MTMTEAEVRPVRTQEEIDAQRKDALRKGNLVRKERSAYRKAVSSGDVDWRGILSDPPAVLLEVPVHDFLKWISGIHDKRAKVIRKQLIISETAKLGTLSPVTRQRVIERVGHYKPSYSLGEALAA